MEELLTLARQLRPTALDDLGLEAALAGNVRELANQGVVQASFDADGELRGLPEGRAAGRLPRRPGGALERRPPLGAPSTSASACVARRDRVELSVADDGRGFTFDQTDRGLGIGGMRERALLVGGEFQIESRPGIGTRVRLLVPIETTDDASNEG